MTDPQKECTCTPLQIQRYRSKVCGPLLDRIDIQVEVPGLRYQELASKDPGESSDLNSSSRQCGSLNSVTAIRESKDSRQRADGHEGNQAPLRRDGRRGKITGNGHQQIALEARAYSRVLKVGRTIADLAGAENIEASRTAEAIQYRSLDRRM